MFHYKLSTVVAACITACAVASTLQAQGTETFIQCRLGEQCRVSVNLVLTPSTVRLY